MPFLILRLAPLFPLAFSFHSSTVVDLHSSVMFSLHLLHSFLLFPLAFPQPSNPHYFFGFFLLPN